MIGKLIQALPALLLLAPAAAHAGDERLITRFYDSGEVVRITGKMGVQATIGFGENEHIENVAVGDAETWQITPNKRADLLFVKPLAANARTNMTVVTDKRTYFFDLAASPQAKPVYMLRFAYKDEPRTPPASGQSAVPLAALSGAERGAIDPALGDRPLDAAMLNFSWRKKGAAALFPSRVYDDGTATFLLWSDKQQIPAILVRNEKGEEGAVNYAVRGPAIVLDEVPGEIVLRIGRKMATLENMRGPLAPAQAPSPAAVAPAAAAQAPETAPAAVAASDRPTPQNRSQSGGQ